MTSPLDQALTELDGVERGFVLGALLAGGVDDPAFVGAIEGASRERCGRALAALAALPREDRVRLTGVLAREARSTWPTGIEDVHADHLRAVLDEESADIVRLVQGEGPASFRTAVAAWGATQDQPESSHVGESADPELRAEALRSVFAGLAEVAPAWRGVAPTRWSRQASLLAPTALLELVTECGTQVAPTAPPDQQATAGACAVGGRLARENPQGLGAADEALAVAQRLPRALAGELLGAVRGGSPENSGAARCDEAQGTSPD